MEIAPGEMVEKELDSFVARRARDNPDEIREELYMESVRRYNAGRWEQHLWDCLRHHESMIRAHTVTLAGLIEGHEREASRCRVALGLENNEERKSA